MHNINTLQIACLPKSKHLARPGIAFAKAIALTLSGN
jgi:hypothetical protein